MKYHILNPNTGVICSTLGAQTKEELEVRLRSAYFEQQGHESRYWHNFNTDVTLCIIEEKS